MTFREVESRFGLRTPKRKNRELIMKVRASVKKICSDCKIFKRNGVVRVSCKVKKHKQRQG